MNQGYDWVTHYAKFNWTERQSLQTCPLACHGVNSAQSIKTGAVLYRQTKSVLHAANPKQAIQVLDKVSSFFV